MRTHLNYINLVVQFISNHGNEGTQRLYAVLNEIEREKLVDEIILYKPDLSIPPIMNEIGKRNIGLEAAKKAGVTHFMTLDCDEYYEKEAFAKAVDFLDTERITASSVATFMHIKRPIYRSVYPDTTCCSFLTALAPDSRFELGAPYPALVDPTRRLHGERPNHFFPANVIAMQHMNLVRLDFSSKLANSTNAAATDFMSQVREAYDCWQPGALLIFPGKGAVEFHQVEDIFGIDDIFK